MKQRNFRARQRRRLQAEQRQQQQQLPDRRVSLSGEPGSSNSTSEASSERTVPAKSAIGQVNRPEHHSVDLAALDQPAPTAMADDELEPPPASLRRLSYLNRSAAVYKIPINDHSYLMLSSNSVSPASSVGGLSQEQQQQAQVMANIQPNGPTLVASQPQQQQQQQQPIIIVEPHNDDSLRCNCRDCQFFSGWCCMPTILLLAVVVFIVWLYSRSDTSGPSKPPTLVGGGNSSGLPSNVSARPISESDFETSGGGGFGLFD